MTEKNRSDVIYALADYKQLVMAYRTSYAALVKSHAFWRTSALWLAVLLFCGIAGAVTVRADLSRGASETRREAQALRRQLQGMQDRLSGAEQAVAAARYELSKRELVIKQLEKNLSTASKKMVEELLQENQETVK